MLKSLLNAASGTVSVPCFLSRSDSDSAEVEPGVSDATRMPEDAALGGAVTRSPAFFLASPSVIATTGGAVSMFLSLAIAERLPGNSSQMRNTVAITASPAPAAPAHGSHAGANLRPNTSVAA